MILSSLAPTLNERTSEARRLGLPAQQRPSIDVAERARQDQNEVDDDPDAEAAQGEKLKHSRAHLPDVESVHSKDTQEQAQDQCDQARLRANVAEIHTKYGWGAACGTYRSRCHKSPTASTAESCRDERRGRWGRILCSLAAARPVVES